MQGVKSSEAAAAGCLLAGHLQGDMLRQRHDMFTKSTKGTVQQ